MIFKHYTDKLFKFKTRKLRSDFKPTGLWLSCNDNWILFIARKYKYEYNFKIDQSKLIIIKTYNDVKEFTEKYSVKSGRWIVIDWNKVKKDYSGIFIKNANINKYPMKDEYLWYEMIDICSACIWNKDAIIEYSGPM